jgi:hypothetical protein
MDRIALMSAILWNKSSHSDADTEIDDLVETAMHLESRVHHVLGVPTSSSEDIELLNTYDVARYLGMCPGSLCNWRSAGRGPAYVKLGSKIMYQKVDIERFIQDKQNHIQF